MVIKSLFKVISTLYSQYHTPRNIKKLKKNLLTFLRFRGRNRLDFFFLIICNKVAVNLLHNFRTPFLKNTSGRLPLTKWWVLLSCIISAVVQEITFIFQDYCNGILFSCSLFLLLFVVLTPFVLRHFFTAKVITGSVISRSVFRNLSNI